MLPLLMFEVSRILSSSDIHLCECTQFYKMYLHYTKLESKLKYICCSAVVTLAVIISLSLRVITYLTFARESAILRDTIVFIYTFF